MRIHEFRADIKTSSPFFDILRNKAGVRGRVQLDLDLHSIVPCTALAVGELGGLLDLQNSSVNKGVIGV